MSMNRFWQFSAILLTLFSILPDQTFAQEYDYAAFGLFPQGSARAMGMGGAYTAVSSDIYGLIYNPGGIAQGNWDFDFGGTHNRIDNREYQVTGSSVGYGIPYSFIFYGGAFRLGSWALAAGYNSPYKLEQSQADTFLQREQTIEITTFSVALSKRFFKKLSVGVAGHIEELNMEYIYNDGVSFNDNERAEAKLSYHSYGVVYKGSKLSFGVSYSPQRKFEIDETLNNSLSNQVIWFRDVVIPAKTSIGLGYQLKKDILIVFDLDRYEPIDNTVLPGTAETEDLYVTTMMNQEYKVLHGGFEWALSQSAQNEVLWRLGFYKEPKRFFSTQDRNHFTMGLEVRFGPTVLSVAYDSATNFKNTSAGFSLKFGKI